RRIRGFACGLWMPEWDSTRDRAKPEQASVWPVCGNGCALWAEASRFALDRWKVLRFKLRPRCRESRWKQIPRRRWGFTVAVREAFNEKRTNSSGGRPHA